MLKAVKDFIHLWMDWQPSTVRIGADPCFVAPNHLPVLQVVIQVNRELNALDTRDFEPVAQCGFLVVRGKLAHQERAGGSINEVMVRQFLTELLPILEKYKGPGSGIPPRSFSYITDPQLRQIVERDYGELVVKLFPSGAWKSAVIMAGSILEAILFDRLTDPKWNARAVASPKALHPKTGKPIPSSDWRLENLIDIALDITLLKPDPANTIHQVLRDYRNFVHPKKEIRAAHECGDAEAMIAVGALKSVCNYIEANP